MNWYKLKCVFACLHDEDDDSRDDLSSVWWRVERIGEEWAGEC